MSKYRIELTEEELRLVRSAVKTLMIFNMNLLEKAEEQHDGKASIVCNRALSDCQKFLDRLPSENTIKQ